MNDREKLALCETTLKAVRALADFSGDEPYAKKLIIAKIDVVLDRIAQTEEQEVLTPRSSCI